MAPKTYGKKSHVRPAKSFAQCLSPDKDVRAVKMETNWRKQLEEAARGEVNGREEGDGLAGLEEQLGGLTMGSTKGEGVTVTTADRSRDTDSMTKAHASTDDTLEKGMEGLNLVHKKSKMRVQVVIPARKGGPRKVLEDRDVNAATKDEGAGTTDTKGEEQKLDFKEKAMGKEVSPPSTPVRKRKNKSKTAPTIPHLPTPESTPEPENVYSAYVSPLLSLSYGKKIVPFEQWSSELQPHFEITKIAEASFSEVYRLSAITTTPNGIAQESVLKLIGLKTPPDAPLPSQTQARTGRDRSNQAAKELQEREEKDAYKSCVADVLSEVRLLQNLTSIPGFTIFRDLTVLQGRPSSLFNAAWTKWNKARPRGKKSYFPDPSKKASYDATQLWAVVEMQDAGTDVEKLMESGGLASVWAVWDVFWGVCASVAKAEEVCSFEHRDLHLGNICVRPSRPDANVMNPQVEEPLRRKMGFTGLETTVIDYTLSRAEIVASSTQQPTDGPLDIAYLDLDKDPAVFEGDAQEEYQYEIYRYMRGVALYNNPLQQEPPPPAAQTPRRSPRKNTHIRFDNADSSPTKKPLKNEAAAAEGEEEEEEGNVWRAFHPRTNLVWAHFLLHKMLAHLKSTKSIPATISSSSSSKRTSKHPAGEDETDEEKIKRKEAKLYKILLRVAELLCPVALGREGSLGGVKELVVLAIEERWLRVGDVRG